VPSAAPEPLRERGIAPSCAPGPLFRHAASEEALLGKTRAFVSASRVPPSDEVSISRAARPGEPREAEAPLMRPVAAPVTASTIESARGLMCRRL
jgi:hypothetical protein